MFVYRSAPDVEIWAPAKLNLFLEVLTRRHDGFHEVETLMCPIRLYDTLFIRDDCTGEVSVSCDFAAGNWGQQALGAANFPEGSDNSVVRAVELVRQRAGVARGASIRLVKRIPVASGLAGGSSDAAAALVGACVCWGIELPSRELAELAAEIGSDVPFFLEPGPAICRGRGERIGRLPARPKLDFVVVRPPAGLSTADVYRACRPAARPRSLAPLLAAWAAGDRTAAGRCLHNRLEPAAATLSPWIARLRQEFDKLDVLGHQMSGSGTAYFGLCRNARQARRLAAHLRNRGVGQACAVSSCR